MSNEPDSWEDNDCEDVGTRLTNLNINASAFVPNAYAAAFVPGGVSRDLPTNHVTQSTNHVTPPTNHLSDRNGPPGFAQKSQSNGHAYGGNQPEPQYTSIATRESQIISLSSEKTVDDVQMMETDVRKADESPPPPPVSDDMAEEEEEETPEEEEVEEMEEEVAAPIIPKEERKDNVNIVFIGHVDAGKSTIGGHILKLTGQVDKRTLEKYEKEAREMNRESWYLSWALDTNDEERNKGKTVEVGRGHFKTEKKHYTLLDAPGHKCFVANMIGGAAQADVAILVISARKGEFETGFDRGGQTQEHTILAKTAGVKRLVVLINKMDDPSVEWDKARYDEIVGRLTPFLKKNGFKSDDVMFMPASGITGANLKEPIDPAECKWYSGPPFLQYLDDLPSFRTNAANEPFRLSVVEKFSYMGAMVMGKVISGTCSKNENMLLMPNKTVVQIEKVLIDDEEAGMAQSGDNVKLRLKNIEEEDISAGFVLCSKDSECKIAERFLAKIHLKELRNIIAPGFKCIMHVHSAIIEVTFEEFVGIIDGKTGKKKIDRNGRPEKPSFGKEGQMVVAKLRAASAICIESYDVQPQLSRFTLRDEGKTIAVGLVLKISELLTQSQQQNNN